MFEKFIKNTKVLFFILFVILSSLYYFQGQFLANENRNNTSVTSAPTSNESNFLIDKRTKKIKKGDGLVIKEERKYNFDEMTQPLVENIKLFDKQGDLSPLAYWLLDRVISSRRFYINDVQDTDGLELEVIGFGTPQAPDMSIRVFGKTIYKFDQNKINCREILHKYIISKARDILKNSRDEPIESEVWLPLKYFYSKSTIKKLKKNKDFELLSKEKLPDDWQKLVSKLRSDYEPWWTVKREYIPVDEIKE